MSVEPSKDLEAFRAFAQDQLDGAGYTVVANVLTLYRQRQEEIERVRGKIEPALAQADRGQSREIDFEQLKAKGRQRLAEEGVTD